MVYNTDYDDKKIVITEKELARVNKRIERMEREHYWNNDRLVNWCYALTGIIVVLLCILFVLICNIYFRLGVIPDFGV